jgi:hypothetical protein
MTKTIFLIPNCEIKKKFNLVVVVVVEIAVNEISY